MAEQKIESVDDCIRRRLHEAGSTAEGMVIEIAVEKVCERLEAMEDGVLCPPHACRDVLARMLGILAENTDQHNNRERLAQAMPDDIDDLVVRASNEIQHGAI